MSLSALTQKKLGKEKGQTNWYWLDQCSDIQTYIPKIVLPLNQWVEFVGFFIEFKFFQLVVEEGGNFFSLRVFEQGKHFMKSVSIHGQECNIMVDEEYRTHGDRNQSQTVFYA